MADKAPHIPEKKQLLLDKVVNHLSMIPGMAAIVLGGSYASGDQQESSDLDIGLYYYEKYPFSVGDVRHLAQKISVDRNPTVTGFYEWGAWVNGGAWIQTEVGKIDLLYRNFDHVKRTLDEARKGIVHHDYDQQPTNGFYSVMYLAETQICVPLYDPSLIVAELKQQVEAYPPKLKQKIVADALWGAEFTLLHARGFAAQGDIYNTVGCLVRTAANLTQALFALNERYFLRDKMVLKTLATFQILPSGYVDQISHLLAAPGSTPQELSQTVSNLTHIWQSVTFLPTVQYEAKFLL